MVVWLRQTLLTEGMINPEDMDLIQMIDDPASIVTAIFKHYESRDFELFEAEREMQLNLKGKGNSSADALPHAVNKKN